MTISTNRQAELGSATNPGAPVDAGVRSGLGGAADPGAPVDSVKSVDDGISLVELLVIMVLMGVVGAIALSAVITIFRTETLVLNRTEAQNQVQLAVDQISASARNSAWLDTPQQIGNSWVLVGFEQPTGTGAARCQQWQYRTDTGALRYRTWPAGTPGQVTPWRNVASNLATGTLNPAPFVVSSSAPASNADQLAVTISAPTTEGAPVTVRTMVYARNVANYPNPASAATVCASRPTL